MKNKYTLLRHAETQKDPEKAVPDWDLVPEALEIINEYIALGKFDNVTKIISSTEPKAIATGKPIFEYLQKKSQTNSQIKYIREIESLEEFVEVKREKKWLSDEGFLEQKKRELQNLDQIENGAESASAALARFESGIEKLEEKYNDEKNPETILIITHGTIMTLYLAKLNHDSSNLFEKWQNREFCELVNLDF